MECLSDTVLPSTMTSLAQISKYSIHGACVLDLLFCWMVFLHAVTQLDP